MLKSIARYFFTFLTACAFFAASSTLTADKAEARPPAAIENVENEKLPAGASIEQVEQAVLASLTARNWQLVSRSPGLVEAKYAPRTFSATIQVTYSASAFSIAYKDSTGLEYNAAKNSIHPNYNRWINNLKVDISRIVQNSVLGVPPPAPAK